MPKEKRLLLIVDYQVDFAAPDGILTAGAPARAIEPYLLRRVEETLASGQDVIFTLDTHTRETWDKHPESASFPLHCEKGTDGWRIYGGLARYAEHPGVALVEKTAYCPEFALLEKWVKQYDVIEIMGLVTNICVLHSAVGLYTAKVNGHSPVQLIVREEGCASFDGEAERFALNHMFTTLQMRP